MEVKNIEAFTVDHMTHMCNLIHGSQNYGYQTPKEGNVQDLVRELLNDTLPIEHAIHAPLLKYNNVRVAFVENLKKALKPYLLGMGIKWRKSQDECIEAILKSMDRGYVRLVNELPTGVGKSLIEGALVKAALNTMKQFGLDYEIHIITSRVAIAGQLIYEELPDDEKDDEPLEMGKPGDVRIWCPELHDDQIRILAGKSGSSKKELQKDSVLTVSTYQGLRVGRIVEHFRKPVFMIICDESHHTTERVTMHLEQMKSSFAFAFSATVLGPNRDPFIYFERVERPEIIKEKKTYMDYLCYYKSMGESVYDKELKPIRWIDGKVKINVSDVKTRPGMGVYDIFNNESVAQAIAQNADLAVQIIEEAFLTEHVGLELSNSMPIWRRSGLVAVERVNFAIDCVELCNKILPEKLKKKYGEDAYFRAGYVDGKMTKDEYKKAIKDFKAGRITLLFSVKKIGEGVNLLCANLLILLKAFGLGSMWELKQWLGRPARVDPDNPLGDMVVLDSVYQSDKHLLASIFGIFGQSTSLSGGLVAGWGNSYELEKKIIGLLRTCKTITELWNMLSVQEQDLFPFLRDKVIEDQLKSERSEESHPHLYKSGRVFDLKSVHFVERDDIQFSMSLGNPEAMAKYALETLIDQGFNTAERLRAVRDHSLLLWSRRRLGAFRDGLTMVNLVLGMNEKALIVPHMTSFIELMKKIGLPIGRILVRREIEPVVENRAKTTTTNGVSGRQKAEHLNTKKKEIRSGVFTKLLKVQGKDGSVESLYELCRDLFGIEPVITVITKDFYTKTNLHRAQAVIILPDGHKYSSTVRESHNEETAKHSCAAELEQSIHDLFRKKEIKLYKGSPLFMTYLKLLRIIICEYGFGEIDYTPIIEANGVKSIQASVANKKGRIPGGIVSHREIEIAKQHADITLCFELLKLFPGFYQDEPFMETHHKNDLDILCRKMNLTFKKEYVKIRSNGYDLHKATITCTIYKKVGFGINQIGAMEKASAGMIYELKKFDN